MAADGKKQPTVIHREATADMGNQAEQDLQSEMSVPIAEIDESTRKLIGQKLSSYYSALVSEPVPDRFIDLLKRLESKESGQ